MNKTRIEWCDATFNPVTGCYHGCDYCYARRIAERFSGQEKAKMFYDGHPYMWHKGHGLHELDYSAISCPDRKEPYPFGFEPTLHRYKLDEPQHWRKPRTVFVCSMADLFGEWVPDEWIEAVFDACEKAPQHNYLFLTKNAERYTKYGVPIVENMWYGTSITNRDDVERFHYLLAFCCHTFVSLEPLQEDIIPQKCSTMFQQIDWFIIGAETGNRKNKVVPERKWIEDIVDECRKFSRPVFMKTSLAPIWGEPLIQEFPLQLGRLWKGGMPYQ